MKKGLLILATALMMSSCYKEKKRSAIVLDHVVTANKDGFRTYSTIVKTTDGKIREVTGLSYYVVPKGHTTVVSFLEREK